MSKVDTLDVICMWFIMGIIGLPSVEIYFHLGIINLLELLGINAKYASILPKQGCYNYLAASLQWNKPRPPKERKYKHSKIEFLYLIRPMLTIMHKNFPKALVLGVVLTVDESLWSFKGQTYLKIFMKNGTKKNGFIEYALCALNGNFYQILVCHLPGKEKSEEAGVG